MNSQNDVLTSRKAKILKSLMKNPTLSSTVFEAMNSPIGSTKRTKLRNIMLSMERSDNSNNIRSGMTIGVNDGKGGSISDYFKNAYTNQTNKIDAAIENREKNPLPTGVGNVNIIKSIDDKITSAENTLNKTGIGMIGTGTVKGTGSLYNKTVTGLTNAEIDIASDVATGVGSTVYPWAKTTFVGAPLRLGEDISGVGRWLLDSSKTDIYHSGIGYDTEESSDSYSSLKPTLSTSALNGNYYGTGDSSLGYYGTPKESDEELGMSSMYPNNYGRYFRVTGKDAVYDSETGMYISYDFAKKNNIWNKIQEVGDLSDLPQYAQDNYTNRMNSNMAFINAMSEGMSENDAYLEAKNKTGLTPDIGFINNYISSNPSLDPTFGASNLLNKSTSEVEEIFSNMDASEQAFYADSLEIANIVKDAESAYSSGMGKNYFVYNTLLDKEKLGEMLGMTADEAAALPEGLLSTQLQSLYDAKKEEYGLNSKLERLNDLQNQGLTIESDMRSYISGKDEYLARVDELLEETKDRVANMDTSNPQVAARLENYTNYLTILKGRQNKRYIDFLNVGIDYHNAQATQAYNSYQASYSQFKSDYDVESVNIEENYETMKSILEGIYDAVVSSDESELKAYELETDRIEAEASAGLDIAKTEEIYYKIDNGITGTSSSSGISSATSNMYTSYYAGETDDETNAVTSYKVTNPISVREMAIEYGDSTGDAAVSQFMSSAGYSAKTAASSGNTSMVNTFSNAINELNYTASSIAAKIEAGDYSDEDAETMQTVVDTYQQDASELSYQLYSNTLQGLQSYFDSSAEKKQALLDAIEELSNIEGKILGQSWLKKEYSKEKFVKEYGEDFGSLADSMYDMAYYNYSYGKSLRDDYSSGEQFAKYTDSNASSMMADALSDYLINNVE